MAQFLRPNSDVSATNWTNSYTTIDEVSYSDADFLQGSNSANGTTEKGLSSVTDPSSSSGHVVRFRAWQQNNAHQRTLIVTLVQGTTTISSYNSGTAFNLVKGTATSYDWTLSSGEADSITDYADLRLRFTSGGTVGTPSGSRSLVYVSWAEMETPDAGATTHNGTATLSASSSLIVAGSTTETHLATSTLSATSTLTVSGVSTTTHSATSTLTGSSSLTASGSVVELHNATTTLSATSSLTVAGVAESPFPQVVSLTPSLFGSDAQSHLVAMPSSVNAGDLLLVIFTNDGSSTVTASGFSVLDNTPNGTVMRTTILAKIAVGNEDGTTVDFVTTNSEQAVAHVYQIQNGTWGGNLSSSIEFLSATGVTANPDSPSLSPTWGQQYTLWIAAYGADDDDDATGYPTSYTNTTYTESASATTSVSTGSARRENYVATENPSQFTMSASEDWVAYTIAINPEAPGAQTHNGTATLTSSSSLAVLGSTVQTHLATTTLSGSSSLTVAATTQEGSVTHNATTTLQPSSVLTISAASLVVINGVVDVSSLILQTITATGSVLIQGMVQRREGT